MEPTCQFNLSAGSAGWIEILMVKMVPLGIISHENKSPDIFV